MIVLSDTGFHAAEGDPANLTLCQRGEWQDRMLVETVLSMLTLVCHLKKVMHWGWAYFQARLAVTACNGNGSGLQSAPFPDHILCISPSLQDGIMCH